MLTSLSAGMSRRSIRIAALVLAALLLITLGYKFGSGMAVARNEVVAADDLPPLPERIIGESVLDNGVQVEVFTSTTRGTGTELLCVRATGAGVSGSSCTTSDAKEPMVAFFTDRDKNATVSVVDPIGQVVAVRNGDTGELYDAVLSGASVDFVGGEELPSTLELLDSSGTVVSELDSSIVGRSVLRRP